MDKVKVRIEGRVQGVGFRFWTREIARELGVRGSVRNLPDGAVQVEAQAESTSLAAFLERLGQGPPGADVTGLHRLEPSTSPLGENFRIER
jgi:acylphosphatase